MSIEEKVAHALISNKLTLSTAESCTGGLVANRLTNIQGSSQFLKCGLITYSNEAKSKLLNIPAKTITTKGAVHEDIALLMAQNVQKLFKTDFGIGITGIAGPTGGTKSKPVGLVYIAAATETDALCLKCQFKGTRLQIKRQASTQALRLLLEFLE